MLLEQRFIAHFVDGSQVLLNGIAVFGIMRATFIDLGLLDDEIDERLSTLFADLDNDNSVAKSYMYTIGLEYLGVQHLNLVQ